MKMEVKRCISQPENLSRTISETRLSSSIAKFTKSGLGHLLADPQILEDGTICNIFEGGHVHLVGTRDAEMYVAAPNVLDKFHGSIVTVSLRISAQPSTNQRRLWLYLMLRHIGCVPYCYSLPVTQIYCTTAATFPP